MNQLNSAQSGSQEEPAEEFEHARHWGNIFRQEFEKESDRAAVIVAASIFDNSLSTLLKNHFVANASSTDELFDGANSPLSTFSAKIAIAHRLGLISSQFCRNLHLIRRIRNEFAHNIHGCSFEDSGIKTRVLEMYRGQIYDSSWEHRKNYPTGPRGDFLVVCLWMLWSLNSLVQNTASLQGASLEFGFLKTETSI